MTGLTLTYIDESTDLEALLAPYMNKGEEEIEIRYVTMNDYGDKSYYLTVTNNDLAIANLEKIGGRLLERAYAFEWRENTKIIRYTVSNVDKLLARLKNSTWVKQVGGVKFVTIDANTGEKMFN